MLATLLTTLLNSTDITQPLQSVSISAYTHSQPALQANQSVNAQGFVKIQGNIAVEQAVQSVNATGYYYDVLGAANIVQPIQSVSVNGYVQINGIGNIVQPIQTVYAIGLLNSGTAITPLRLNDRVWILRKVRNKGTR